MGGALTEEDEITKTPKVAFRGGTLDDLPAQCSFFSSIYGVAINNKYAPVVGMHRQTCDMDGDGHIDKIALQMSVYDDAHTKGVIVILTNGDDGNVYIQRYCQFHKEKSPDMWLPYYTLNADGTISQANYPSSWNTNDSGYGYQIAGFKIRGTSPLLTSALAFPGKSLAQLKNCAFVSAYRFGRAMGTIATNNFASFVTAWPSIDEPKKLVMQFVNPNDMQKTAIIEMTNGVGGVYAYQSHHAYDSSDRRFSVNADNGAVSPSGSKSYITTLTPPNYPVHGLYVLPIETVKNSPVKIKAFSSGDTSAPLTLDDIKYGVFSSRMCGINVGSSFLESGSAMGYNKKVYENDSGSVTNIIVEFQVLDGDFTKCVVVSFENGEGGVYASALGAKYITSEPLGYEFFKEDGTWDSGISEKTVSETFESGYGIFDLRVTVDVAMEWTLDQNHTWSELRNGATLAEDEVVRIKVTGENPTLTIDENVKVAKVEFVNETGSPESTNAIEHFGGVSFEYTMLSLGEHVNLALPGSLAPSAVSAAGGSTLIYTSGEAVLAAIDGLGRVEVARGAKLYVDGIAGVDYILNNGTVVKRIAEDLSIPFHAASAGVTIVENGTLKVASYTGAGDSHTVRVASGATFDLNGYGNNALSVILEEGAHFVNSGAFISNNSKQAKSITLEGDATATAIKGFGLVAPGHKESFLNLNSNTLTLDGSSCFWLCNTTVTGTGTIAIENGVLQVPLSSSFGEECTLNIGANGTLRIDNGLSLTVNKFCNGGTIMAPFKEGNGWYAQGTLVVTGTLISGNPIPKLTLGNGATIKATGTAQVVSTMFTATGSYTIDASAITKAQLKEAADGRIPVLTVPTANKGGAWTVVNPPVDGCRAKWIDNEDGSSTLYLCRSSGTMIIVR